MSGNPGAGVGAGNAAGVCAGSAGAGNAIADDEDDGVSAGRHVESTKCAFHFAHSFCSLTIQPQLTPR